MILLHRNRPFISRLLLMVVIFFSGMVVSQHSVAMDDGLVKFKGTDDKPLPKRYKDNTADAQENIRTIELLKEYARQYTPIPVADEAINTINVTFGSRNWSASYGRTYHLLGYETEVAIYVNQVWNKLDDYQLWIQTRKEGSVITNREVYDDLEYTLTSFGVSGTLYYFSSPEKTFSLGFELPVLGVSRLNIESKDADKSYVINGFSLLGYPVWRHTNITPIKFRYRPVDNFALFLNVQYVVFEIVQETSRNEEENANTPGEWFHGCDGVACSVSEVVPALGFQLVF